MSPNGWKKYLAKILPGDHNRRASFLGYATHRQHVAAHHRSGKQAQLAWGGTWEHEAFWGHEIRSTAGTGRGGVTMDDDGWGAVACHHHHDFGEMFYAAYAGGCQQIFILYTYIHEFLCISYLNHLIHFLVKKICNISFLILIDVAFITS